MADLSVADQCDIVLKAEQVWNDSQNQTEMYTADAETIKALAERQQGRTQIITELENPELEGNNVKIVWLDNCGEELDDNCQDVCALDAAEVAMASKNFTLNNCKSASFKIDENDVLRNRYTLDEIVARKLLAKMKALDEWINAKSLLFLSASAGYNKNPEAFTFNATTLEVPEANYTTEMYVKMAIDAKINKITDPFVVDSGALYRYFLNAQIDKDNAEGSGNNKRTMLFPTSFDLVGFPSAPITDSTFLVSSSAYAFASRNYNGNTPVEVNPKEGRQIRWSMPSNTVPGLRYDIYHEYVCSGKRFTHTYYIEANFGFALNPVGCDVLVSTGPDVFDQVSGILSYTKVANP